MSRGRPTVTTLRDARQKVRFYLDQLEEECRKAEELRKDLTPAECDILGSSAGGCRLAIVDEATIEGDFGWAFFYESQEYQETGDLRDMLAGNAPILISRRDGSLHITGTAMPLEHYIENFIRSGDPND